MIPILLLFWLLQGIPVPPSQSGTIAGVLRTAVGGPAAGVRVSAMVQPDSPQDALGASALAGIAETDTAGRFTLENIPPGRYYIVAGRIDLPTYYPGTLEMSAARPVLVTPGLVLSGMDFAMKENSAGRADPGLGGVLAAAVSWTVPTQVTVEGGGKVPIFDAGLFPLLRITRISDGQQSELALTETSIVLPLTPTPEYRVTIENLSNRYRVKSMVSDSSNLLIEPLRLPAPPAGTVSIAANPGGTTAIPGTGVQQLFIILRVNALGATQAISAVQPLPPVKPIVINLATVAPQTPRSGITVMGNLKSPFNRGIYLSGIPGTVYADGTFEFRNVPPGRHTILTRNEPLGTRPIGASIVVGDQDISGVDLQQILETPLDPDSTSSVLAAGPHLPGSIVTLASVRGRLLNDATGQRYDLGRAIGRVTVNGNTVSYTINNAGEFEIQGLLPGRYNLDVWIFGGNTYTRSIVVGDDNIDLELAVSVPD